MLPLPLIAPNPVALGAILFVFGAVNGAMDVSMNAHGVAVERDLERPIMSSLHGGWSVGGFFAAGLSAVAGAAGADPRVLALGIGIALWLVSLLSDGAARRARRRTARAPASRCRRAA